MESTIVRTSKLKLIAILLGGLLLFAISIKMVYDPKSLISHRYSNPGIIWLVGVVGSLFFGACLIVGFRTMFGNRRLIIDDKGIYNNTNLYGVEFVPWKDVKGIRQGRVQSSKFLLIDVRNPKSYISNSTGFIRTRLLKINYRYYKTPVIISCNILECKVDELETVILTKIEWCKENQR